MKRKILITCALPYANGPIHIGHMMEHIEADIYSRFQKMQGNECLFVCADDTHGTPIMIAAKNANMTPEKWIENSYHDHLKDFKGFNIDFDHYGSTNSAENKQLCELFFSRMKAKNLILKKPIEQLYCEHDKMFLPDRFVKGQCPKCNAVDQYGDSCDVCGATYSPEDLKKPGCSLCGTAPVKKPSDHIFFKLNHFKDYLTKWLPEHTEPEVSKKMLEWFNEDLRDLDISRDEPYFGFPIPGEEQNGVKKYFYVWVDAPMGYISATEQYLKTKNRSISEFWDKDSTAEVYHFIGKDIVYFHTLFWPSFLASADFRTPTKVNVHGHVMVNGEKMSKSKGTFISASIYLKYLDPQYLRYYYATKLNGSIDDLDLSFTDFTNRVNSDLVGKIVNLASRGAQMINKKFDNKMSTCDAEGLKVLKTIQDAGPAIAKLYNDRDTSKATTAIRELAELTNKYFDEKAPWKTADSSPAETQMVLTTTLNAFRILAIYLKPILPVLASQVETLMNENAYDWSDSLKIIENHTIQNYIHLASRVDKEKIDLLISEQKLVFEKIQNEKDKQQKNKFNAAAQKPEQKVESAEIEFSDFEKIDLRIAKIIEAEEIKEADKLLRVKVELSDGQTKQIIAGIKSAYSADKILGRMVLICANLKPRKMKFGISEGMILAAGDGGSDLFILSPDDGAKIGAKVK
jgi:methionyl-tRNA synthetase